MNGQETRRRRILLGAASFADAASAIAIAEKLADALHAELGGLFFEGPAAGAVAVSSVQRVVTSTGTLAVAPSQAQARLLVASEARAFRSSLSRIARARALSWSFEQRAGDPVPGLFEAAREWDLLVFGHRPVHRHSGAVVLLGAADGAESEAAALADALASALKTAVVTLDAPAEGGPAREAEEAILSRINRLNASAVIVDLEAGPPRTGEQLRHLLEAARCPVLVCGAVAGGGRRPPPENSLRTPEVEK